MIIRCAKCGAKNRVNEVKGRQPICGRCGATLDASATDGAGQTSTPRAVTDANFKREVLETRGKPVLLDCWAEWCGPCHMLAPVMDELAAESQGRYLIMKLNVDENPIVASQFNIRSIPTMLIFRDGALVDRLVGVQSKQAIAARLG
jgi:thioredoxin